MRARRHFYESGAQENFFQKGGGIGKGKGKRKGNPRGPDGQPLRCSVCGSTEHFWHNCPQKGKGKGAGVASSSGAHGPNLYTESSPLDGFITDHVNSDSFLTTTHAEEPEMQEPVSPPVVHMPGAASRVD